MRHVIKRFWTDQSGATSIEYALIATLISSAIIGGATLLGGKVNSTLTSVAGNF